MSKTLERMKATMEKKKRQMQSLQADVASFERVIAYYERYPDELEVRVATPEEVKDVMFAILDRTGKPLHYKNDLFPLVQQSNVEIAGQEPARNVGAYLSSDERFVSYGDGMWGLGKWRERNVPSEPNNGHNRQGGRVVVG